MDEFKLDIGIHKNIAFSDYKRIKAVNNSYLSKFSQTPAHAKDYLENNSEVASASMVLGGAFHQATLEPYEFYEKYAIAPDDINLRTKAGKEEYAAFKELHKGKEIITAEVSVTASIMADTVRNHNIAKKFITGGDTELTIIWEINGILCKGRIDKKLDGIVVDLKSSRNAEAGAFRSSFFKYFYHQQGAFYCDGIKALTGEDCSFVVVVQESDSPYGTNVFEVKNDVLELGRQEYMKHLEEHKLSTELDFWPCYPEELNIISL